MNKKFIKLSPDWLNKNNSLSIDKTIQIGESDGPKIIVKNGSIIFEVNDKPVLELREDGSFIVKGRVIEGDKDVVDAMRRFLNPQNSIDFIKSSGVTN